MDGKYPSFSIRKHRILGPRRRRRWRRRRGNDGERARDFCFGRSPTDLEMRAADHFLCLSVARPSVGHVRLFSAQVRKLLPYLGPGKDGISVQMSFPRRLSTALSRLGLKCLFLPWLGGLFTRVLLEGLCSGLNPSACSCQTCLVSRVESGKRGSTMTGQMPLGLGCFAAATLPLYPRHCENCQPRSYRPGTREVQNPRAQRHHHYTRALVWERGREHEGDRLCTGVGACDAVGRWRRQALLDPRV